MVELERVGAEVLLVVLQVVDAGAEVLAAAAVEREHDLVADVDAGEPAVRAEDLGEMVELGARELRRLGALGARLRAGFEIGADLLSASSRRARRRPCGSGSWLPSAHLRVSVPSTSRHRPARRSLPAPGPTRLSPRQRAVTVRREERPSSRPGGPAPARGPRFGRVAGPAQRCKNPCGFRNALASAPPRDICRGDYVR